MFLITLDKTIRGVAGAWHDQYPNDNPNYDLDEDKRIIGNKLSALDTSYKVGYLTLKEQVDKIIGNSTWTTLMCEECGKEVEALVEFDGTMSVCKECLQNALGLFEQES